MNPPAVIIRLEFERPAPRVICDYFNEGDELRMRDWLSAHPDLLRLLGDVFELAEREQAA